MASTYGLASSPAVGVFLVTPGAAFPNGEDGTPMTARALDITTAGNLNLTGEDGRPVTIPVRVGVLNVACRSIASSGTTCVIGFAYR